MRDETYTVKRSQLETLAQRLIDNLCPDGTRNSGGRFTHSEGEVLLRRVTAILCIELNDLRNS